MMKVDMSRKTFLAKFTKEMRWIKYGKVGKIVGGMQPTPRSAL